MAERPTRPMTDTAALATSPTPPPTACRRAVVFVSAALLVVAGVVGGVLLHGQQRHYPTAARPSELRSASASSCGLRVVSQGLVNEYGPSVHGNVPASRGELHIGYVVENPCALAAVNCQFAAVVLDAAGQPVPLIGEPGYVASATTIGVIAAGQRVGIAGLVGPDGPPSFDASLAVSLRITVEVVAWRSASALPESRTATAEHIAVVTGRNAYGYVGVTYLVRQGPGPVGTYDATAYTLLTDDAGRIVGAEDYALENSRQQSAPVWVPPDTTTLHPQVWIMQNPY